MTTDRVGHRLQARRGSRWVRNTLENACGLRVIVCPHCQRFNPYTVGDSPPLTCHACGGELVSAPEEQR